MELRHLRYFIGVVEEGSLTTAAARPMPVKAPVINTTGLLICNSPIYCPTGRVWKWTLWPRL